MKKIYYINSLIRKDESRTRKLANKILDGIKDEVELIEINLSDLDINPYNEKTYEVKVQKGVDDYYYNLSKDIANSDGLIIASPFWDMSFPSLLKTFLEKISLFDVMFISNEKECVGIAKCPFMFYIVTRGMKIEEGDFREQGTPYLKALCWLWGIKNFDYVACNNFDYISEKEVENEIEKKAKEGISKLHNLLVE